jgi:toxin secretion/phage lysis holin
MQASGQVASGGAPLGVLKWVGALLVSAWILFPTAIRTLFLMSVGDYISGLLMALILRKVSSRVGLDGLLKKAEMLLLVFAVQFFASTAGLPTAFASTIAFAFTVNEFISIVENCAEAGVPIPPALLDVLARMKNVTGRGKPPAEVQKELG